MRQHQASASYESLFFFSIYYILLELYTSKITESVVEEEEEGKEAKENFIRINIVFLFYFFRLWRPWLTWRHSRCILFIFTHLIRWRLLSLRSHYLIPSWRLSPLKIVGRWLYNFICLWNQFCGHDIDSKSIWSKIIQI